MSEVTVAQLAADVGIPVERLLTQLGEAGISKSSDTDMITEDEKRNLLAFLRQSHGKKSVSPQGGATAERKLTLKRKTVSELKQPSATRSVASRGAPASGKTVSVEVRRKRAVIKAAETAEEKSALLKEAEEARQALAQQEAEKKALAEQEEARRRAADELRKQEEDSRRSKEEKLRAREEEERQREEADRFKKEEEERERLEEEKRKLAEAESTKKAVAKAKANKAAAEEARKKRTSDKGGRKELHVAASARRKTVHVLHSSTITSMYRAAANMASRCRLNRLCMTSMYQRQSL
jgi:translation initiation factor IF-2